MKEEFDRHLYRILFSTALFVLAFGTVFYHHFERLSWLNAYYFSVITLATVGYGDITPHTNAGKIFTTFYVLFGIGIITTFISASFRRRVAKVEQRQARKKQNGNGS